MKQVVLPTLSVLSLVCLGFGLIFFFQGGGAEIFFVALIIIEVFIPILITVIVYLIIKNKTFLNSKLKTFLTETLLLTITFFLALLLLAVLDKTLFKEIGDTQSISSRFNVLASNYWIVAILGSIAIPKAYFLFNKERIINE